MKNLSRSVKKYANFHKRIQLILKTFHRNKDINVIIIYIICLILKYLNLFLTKNRASFV